jgi:hypothetical protein
VGEASEIDAMEVKMRKVQAIVIIAGLMFSLAAAAENKQTLPKMRSSFFTK